MFGVFVVVCFDDLGLGVFSPFIFLLSVCFCLELLTMKSNISGQEKQLTSS